MIIVPNLHKAWRWTALGIMDCRIYSHSQYRGIKLCLPCQYKFMNGQPTRLRFLLGLCLQGVYGVYPST